MSQQYRDLPAQVDRSVRDYIEARRKRVDGFSKEQFSFRQSVRTHVQCVGIDLICYPVNALLAIPLFTVRRFTGWVDQLGWEPAERIVRAIPGGLKTRTQSEIEHRVRDELVGHEFRDRILEDTGGAWIETRHLIEAFDRQVDLELKSFSSARAATRDLAATGWALLVSWLLLRKLSVDPAEIGRSLAGLFARKQAVSGFFLGPKLGSLFYRQFPVHPTSRQVLLASVAVTIGLSILTFLSSLFSDPLQNRLGVHRRRLHQLLDSLESRMLVLSSRHFRGYRTS